MSPAFRLPDVDAIVVNRDGGESLFAALDSLQGQEGIDLSIMVVDNGSDPAEREKITRERPSVRLVCFSKNLGFAAAANEGIARTRADFILLVNNDAVLSPDYVAHVAARLALDDRLAAVQGVVLTADGSAVDTAGLDWNPRGEAVPAFAGARAEDRPSEAFEVSGVSATATLYRRQALSSVAPHGEVFDRSFFAYYEDVDLSLRMARAGWRFVCEPGAVARHEGSRTGRRMPLRRAFWTARNRWRTLFSNFDPSLLARSGTALLRADLAHARHLGWKGAAVPLLVWPMLPAIALRRRGSQGRLSRWPVPAGGTAGRR